MKLRIADLARRDLAAIERYWVRERKSPVAADRHLALAQRAMVRIERAPYAGRPRPEFQLGLRSFAARPYVIYYRIREDIREDRFVEIVRVLHGARDAAAEFADAP
ncbi:MAG: type II toxin-antitoxin system RelE/ParE family toxin [Bryobacteraceae bacterium]|nr:type II toxin-antitoxin system RelE/ParE family toxin [Bryobacteraceae bacterium]